MRWMPQVFSSSKTFLLNRGDPSLNRSDLFFSQQNMNLLCRDESCSVYQMKNETGDGIATYYEVYPGIGVIYNDFHMASCPPRRFDNTHYISIHHCREGRIEWEVSNGAYLYLRFLYKGIIIKHNKTEPTYTKTSLFLCEKRRFFMGRTEKGGKVF